MYQMEARHLSQRTVVCISRRLILAAYARVGTLRFQIEFNFRDAKQYWGLQDFMRKLIMFMVSVSAKLTDTFRCPNTSLVC